ncbi:MAG: hypothetical protein LBV27_10495 [Oscillospiraceae bacterium]|nr:hypothetical protein [Oscillospiraceae bacterium]
MLLPSMVTKTLICVDSTDDFEFNGKMFNSYFSRIYEFRGVMEIIGIMDKFFDSIGYPQPYYSERTFERKKDEITTRREPVDAQSITKHFDEKYYDIYTGRCATFMLQVKYRKNATWQGSVAWREANRSNDFRSTLELIKLMDFAVQNTNGQPVLYGWDIN